MLFLGRAIQGISGGFWSTIGPLYTIEIAPKEYKGIAGSLCYFMFAFGQMISFALGFGLPEDFTDTDN